MELQIDRTKRVLGGILSEGGELEAGPEVLFSVEVWQDREWD